MRKKSTWAPFGAVALPALALGGLLGACTQSEHLLPQPHCSIPATVRRVVSPDSCRNYVLVLNDSSHALLRPLGRLWQSFVPKARNGQRVFVEYVAAVDSGAVSCGRRVGRPVRLTCLSADTVKFLPPTGGGSPHHHDDTTVVVPTDTTRLPHHHNDSTFTRRRF